MTHQAQPALFQRYPELHEQLPWQPLGRFPTALDDVMLETPAGARRVLVKRDDLCGDRYGGNKVRKLEFILPEALRQGAGRLITVGAAGSHHALATALYGAEVGLPATLVLFPQPLTDHVREILLSGLGVGAELRWAARVELVPLVLAAARWSHRRQRPFMVTAGGSDAVGTLGYVNAALELAEQIGAGGRPAPRVVHVAGGTLGTAAGLALGFAMAGIDLPVVATRITSRLITNDRAIRRLVAGASARLTAAGVDVPPVDKVLSGIEIRHDQIGRGYGHSTADAESAGKLFADVGLRLDMTYTAKAAASLLSDLSDDDAAGPPLFWHTLSHTEPQDAIEAAGALHFPSAFAQYLRPLL
jgi:1-aminocyclopropane-1-carboxylate deaminase/D-cysteine desulfhydrase-like pyridoxal-dependent ACC family enzyme